MRKDVTDDEVTYIVIPEVIRYEVCAGFDYRDAERILVSRGWLTQDNEGRATRKERLPGYGKAVRCYMMPLATWRQTANDARGLGGGGEIPLRCESHATNVIEHEVFREQQEEEVTPRG